jgi:uncharacterized membrane protein YvlD (DUF360 family)
MKTFGLFNVVICYMCVMMSVSAVVYQTVFAQEYTDAITIALAGCIMFFIARYMHNEWRQGKL